MKFLMKIILILSICLGSVVAYASSTKTIVLATEATYPPFESMDNQGNMQGFDIEILQAICKEMNKPCRFINQPWDSLIPSLQLGKFDVIFGSMNITPERQKHVDFTEPYYSNSGSFVSAKNSKLNLTVDSLKNKTIGIQGGSSFEDYLQATYGKNITIKRYASFQDALLDLQSGRVDLVLGDSPLILDWLKNPSNNGFALVGDMVDDPKYFGEGKGFAVKKGHAELLQQLNAGLKNIKNNGVFNQINQKYFGKNS